MKLCRLDLINFRNYAKRSFEFGDKTLIVGENGAGKSNIMEAIYLLATGKSFRADRDTEMVLHNTQYSMLNAQGDDVNLQITITDSPPSPSHGFGGVKKKFEVNGVARRQIDFVGNLRAVLFCPQDMELVTGSPGNRRRYLDFVISQVDREYRRCLISYEKGLRQRNKLLEMIRENLAQRSQLYFWDKLLIKDGEYLTEKRGEYLDMTNRTDKTYGTYYDKSVISETRLAQYEMEEVAAATTLVGPHRDDFIILKTSRDVSKYGSRGEQRMAVLGLKQKEIEYLSFDSAQDLPRPLLLLDDIFSELDHRHQEEVMKLVKNYPGQVIMTTTDEHLLPTNGEDTIIEL